MTENQAPERLAAEQIASAVREISGAEDGTFGEQLAWRESGSVLGGIGGALADGADRVAELRISYLLRHAHAVELTEIVHDLAGIEEAPWPQVREALGALTAP